MQKLHFPFLKQFMHCIFWKFLVVSTENKFLFEDSFNVLFVRIIFLWFFMIFIMAYLWKGFSCGFYDFLHAIFVVMVFVVFCFNPLWFLWFLWFLWSLTFYSSNIQYMYIHIFFHCIIINILLLELFHGTTNQGNRGVSFQQNHQVSADFHLFVKH